MTRKNPRPQAEHSFWLKRQPARSADRAVQDHKVQARSVAKRGSSLKLRREPEDWVDVGD